MSARGSAKPQGYQKWAEAGSLPRRDAVYNNDHQIHINTKITRQEELIRTQIFKLNSQSHFPAGTKC